MKSDEVFLVTARDKSVSAATLVRFSAFYGRLLYFDMSPAQAASQLPVMPHFREVLVTMCTLFLTK